MNKTLKVEDIKKLTMDDVFKHAIDMEHERHERRNKMIAIYNTENEVEREILMEKLWQAQVDKNVQSQVAHYSSNFEIDKGLSEEQADVVRMRTKMTNPYAYFQERENRMFKAYEMMAIYKTMH